MKMKKEFIYVSLFLLVLAGCEMGTSPNEVFVDKTSAKNGGKPGSAATIDVTDVKQVIRGFGASSAWHGALTDADCDKLFSDIGLSILRLRIDPDGNWADEISNAEKAKARGAIVFATPWSPPAYMKTNNDLVSGELKPESYAAYADYLNSFVNATSHIPLYAISIQNEPNISVTYESCDWSSSQMFNFMVNNAGVINTRVMMPETFNYLPSYADPILNDPTGNLNTDIAAFHWYGANQFGLWGNAYNKGKDIWMTEVFSDDQSLSAALSTAKDIHDFMTINQTNAYVWWWAKLPNCNLITDSSINPRGYVMGQFAKFVRPGYHRVNVSGGNYISAYTDDNGNAVVVAINSGRRAKNQEFVFANHTISSVVPYVTSETDQLAVKSPVDVSGNSFTYSLPAYSITTFVQQQ